MTEEYERIEKIGEGTYGVVYKVKERSTGKIFALKRIRIENEDEGIPPTTIREISLLKTLKHSTIINLFDVIYCKDKLFLIFEFIETDLKQLLEMMYKHEKLIPEKSIRKMAYQIVTALYVCHSKGILHRDLKPQNILVDKQYNIKIADFGLGRCTSVPLRTYTKDIVTLWYRPPELLLGCKYYAWSVDIWSVGCILCEILRYQPLFPGDSEIDQLYKMFKILGTPNEAVWRNVSLLPNYNEYFPVWPGEDLAEILPENDQLVDLIAKMLIYNPVERITAKLALKHPYFRKLNPILD